MPPCSKRRHFRCVTRIYWVIVCLDWTWILSLWVCLHALLRFFWIVHSEGMVSETDLSLFSGVCALGIEFLLRWVAWFKFDVKHFLLVCLPWLFTCFFLVDNKQQGEWFYWKISGWRFTKVKRSTRCFVTYMFYYCFTPARKKFFSRLRSFFFRVLTPKTRSILPYNHTKKFFIPPAFLMRFALFPQHF